MKKAIIIVDKLGHKKLLLKEYLAKFIKNADIEMGLFSDISFNIDKDVSVKYKNKNLSDYDLVYFRRVGKKFMRFSGPVCLYLREKGIKFIDEALISIGLREDKLAQMVKLSLKEIPVPPTIFIFHDQVMKNLENVGKVKKDRLNLGKK